jgi:hypothetical protein
MKVEEKGFSDLYLIAAILSYSPLSFIRVDKSKPRQVFYFKDEELHTWILTPEGPKKMDATLEEFKNWYTAGILMFPAQFVDCIKKVKTEVHSK